MSPRAGTTRTFTISFPPDLADQVERLAARESRTTSELFREAFRTYRAEQIRAAFQKLRALADARGPRVRPRKTSNDSSMKIARNSGRLKQAAKQ